MNVFDISLKLTTEGETAMIHKLGEIAEKAGSLTARFNQLVTVLAGGEFFKETMMKSAETAERLEILSQKTGETVEKLSALEYAAKQSGVESGTMNIAMRKLAMSMQGVNMETGRAVKAFDQMGINVKDAHGKLLPVTDVLMLMADKFKDYKDGAAKAALAMDVLGRAGTEIIPFLNKGKEGIQGFIDESDRMGITMTTQQNELLVKYQHQMKQLESSFDAAGRAIALGMLPALTNLMHGMVGATSTAEGFNAVTNIVSKVVAFLSNVLIEAKIYIESFVDAVKILWVFIADGPKAAMKKTGELADELTDSMGAAESAIIKNRLIMMGYVHDVEKVDEAVKKVKKDAPTLDKEDTKDTARRRANLDLQLQAAKENLDKQHDLWVAYANEQRKVYGADSKEYLESRKEVLRSAMEIAKKNESLDKALMDEQMVGLKQDLEAQFDLRVEWMNKMEQEHGRASAEFISAETDVARLQEEIWSKALGVAKAQLDLSLEQIKGNIFKEQELWKAWAQKQKAIYGENSKEYLDALKQTYTIGEQLTFSIQQQAKTLSSAIQAAFSAAFQGGGIVAMVKAFGKSILSSIGGVFIQMGEVYLAASPIFKAISTAIGNPLTMGWAAAAYGAALIALGASLSAIGGSGSGGGFSAGTSSASSSVASGQQSINVTTNSAVNPLSTTAKDSMVNNINIIGTNDPVAGRQLLTMIETAKRRGA